MGVVENDLEDLDNVVVAGELMERGQVSSMGTGGARSDSLAKPMYKEQTKRNVEWVVGADMEY